jgi:hypothetical protein
MAQKEQKPKATKVPAAVPVNPSDQSAKDRVVASVDRIRRMERQKMYTLFFVSLVFIALAAFVVGFYLAKDSGPRPVRSGGVNSGLMEEDEKTDEEIVADEEEQAEIDEIISVGGALNIDWLDEDGQYGVEADPALVRALAGPDPDVTSSYRGFHMGEVSGGKYDGFDVTMQYKISEGLGTSYTYFYVLQDSTGSEDSVVLDRYASVVSSFGASATKDRSAESLFSEEELARAAGDLAFDAQSVIAEFEQTEQINDAAGNTFILKGLWHRANYPDDVDYQLYPSEDRLADGRLLRGLPEGLTEKGGTFVNEFFSIREDGRIVFYELEIPFWPSDLPIIGEPDIRWDDESYNRTDYLKGKRGGCGFSEALYVRDRSELGDLVEAGETADGIRSPIYVPADLDTEYYQEGFALWTLFDDTRTFEDFEALHPYFYYEDDLGRWIEFTNAEILPAAECGKPVLYFYPEEEIRMTVELDPKGGFSVTEPAYFDANGNGGWDIVARPDGTLYNFGDQMSYPYLFWEGTGGTYASPENYWLVEKDEVRSFLIDTLYQLGMNQVEISDFLEFWYPRMQSAPYYQIGFHGTDVMDQLAPLKMSVEPDQIIRILMDYNELDAPIASNEPVLSERPSRDGFEVVEWGGVLVR